MSQEWKKPPLTTRVKIIDWETRSLTNPPPVVGEFLNPAGPPPGPQNYATAEADSKLSYHVPNAQLDPWRWVCKIYSRAPTRKSADKDVQLNKGVQLATSWTQATAWFVSSAHGPGQNGQWLLTAAHNFLGRVPEHDEKGKIKDFGKEELAIADAIYVIAGWGQHQVVGWVDRVSVMEDYFLDNINNIHFDGAAIHIKDSPVPAAFWQNAPQVAALPATVTAPIVIAGFPGAINRYANLQGLYLAGRRNAGAAGAAITDFGPVTLTREHAEDHDASHIVLKFDERVVTTAQGVSGSPFIVLVHATQNVVASLHTSGIGSPFVKRDLASVAPTGVDPKGLLLAIHGSGFDWADWDSGAGPWHILRRI